MQAYMNDASHEALSYGCSTRNTRASPIKWSDDREHCVIMRRNWGSLRWPSWRTRSGAARTAYASHGPRFFFLTPSAWTGLRDRRRTVATAVHESVVSRHDRHGVGRDGRAACCHCSPQRRSHIAEGWHQIGKEGNDHPSGHRCCGYLTVGDACTRPQQHQQENLSVRNMPTRESSRPVSQRVG